MNPSQVSWNYALFKATHGFISSADLRASTREAALARLRGQYAGQGWAWVNVWRADEEQPKALLPFEAAGQEREQAG